MSDYKLTFKLKQHTPIIHFQHDQYGATLRASELKPKLDKFLIEKLGGEKRLRKDHPKWFINKEHPALDYKVKVSSNDTKHYILGFPRKKYIKANGQQITDYKLLWDEQFPNYFGNMKKENEKKEPKDFRVSKENIKGKINVFNKKLKSEIGRNLKEFFFLNNFGTRQNKGFGSFGVVEIDGKEQKFDDIIEGYPYFTIDISQINCTTRIFDKNNFTYLPKSINDKLTNLKNNFEQLLEDKKYRTKIEIEWLFKLYNLFYRIELFYKTLRSGINIPGKLYFKSLMFQYAKSLKPSQQWDKKTIREHFYSDFYEYNNLINNSNYPYEGTLKFTPEGTHEKNKLLFRDLLGLSSLQQWRFYNNDTVTKKGTKKKDGQIMIQRFKSPITFKPIKISEDNYRVYLICNAMPQEYLGGEINIYSLKFLKNNPLTLKLPDKFNVCNYIRSAVTEYIKDTKNLGQSYKNHFLNYINNSRAEESKYLYDIFSQLNNFYTQSDKR